MGHLKGHKRGSLAFRPRKRASTLMPRISSWAPTDMPCTLGFAGYKAGMTSVSSIDDSTAPSKGLEISSAATVLEVPPMTVYGYRAYLVGYGGKRALADVVAQDEKILKQIGYAKAPNGSAAIEKHMDQLSDFTLLAFANPTTTSTGAKKPVRMELGVGGKSAKEKYDYCKTVLGKQLRVFDVFKDGEFVNVVAVTTGKGWQGAVKRLGVALQRRKATGRRRHVGTLGPWHPAKVMYTAPMAGQMGFHTRTEYNKRILKMGSDPKDVVPAGGFLHYGVLKNDYVILKGSVAGPVKRFVRLCKATRIRTPVKKPEIKFISLRSKQG